MSQAPPPPSSFRLPPDVLGNVMSRMSVKQSRQLAKLMHTDSPDYTRLLKQRGYTDEFLAELLDVVEMMEPGLLEALKTFYNFRKAHKHTEALLPEHYGSYINELNRVATYLHENDEDVYDRMYLIHAYYRYKALTILASQPAQRNIAKRIVEDYKDNLVILNNKLLRSNALKQEVHNYRDYLEENESHYYLGKSFVESLKVLFNEVEAHFDKEIEAYEAAIRDYHARKAAEQEKAATQRLIARVNKAAAIRERSASASNRAKRARLGNSSGKT